MKLGEILETVAILIALVSLIPIAYWWQIKELSQHTPYLYYLFFMLGVLAFITVRRIRRLRAAMKANEKGGPGSGPRVPPFYQ